MAAYASFFGSEQTKDAVRDMQSRALITETFAAYDNGGYNFQSGSFATPSGIVLSGTNFVVGNGGYGLDCAGVITGGVEGNYLMLCVFRFDIV